MLVPTLRVMEARVWIPIRLVSCPCSFLKSCFLSCFHRVQVQALPLACFSLAMLGGRFRDKVECSREWGVSMGTS